MGARLLRRDFPRYFEALMGQRWVAAHAAQTDPRTADLSEAYLVPLGIHAMLDAPVCVAGETVGVLCHEQAHHERVWTPDEQVFAASVADLVALCMESERRRAVQAAHSRTSLLLELATEAAEIAAWSVDLRTDQVEWSPNVGPMFGRERGWAPEGLAGYQALLEPEDAERLDRVISEILAEGGSEFQFDHRLRHPDGGVRFVEGRGRVSYLEDGQPERVVGVVADATGRRELEMELLQSQKMEGLGRLAGGVAHDLNNLLMVMDGHAELLGPSIEDRAQASADLAQIRGAVRRAADLVQRLLTFARREPIAPKVWELDVLMARVRGLLERVLGEDVELCFTIEPDLRLEVDGSRFEQLLVNLAVNARDAMPRGGHLSIEARREQGAEDDRELLIRVRDDGEGISEHTQARAFDPFFTTKPEGRGTGLGLSICYGIVQQAGGRIGLRPAEPRGTEVWMRFPVSGQPSAAMEDEVSGSPDTLEPPGVGGSILIVEDEPAVRGLLARVLAAAGYRVQEAACPDEALEQLEAADRAPDLILTDLVMPGMPVNEFVELLRERHPSSRLLAMTGYSDEWLDGRITGVSNRTVLHKPIRSAALLDAVREALTGPSMAGDEA